MSLSRRHAGLLCSLVVLTLTVTGCGRERPDDSAVVESVESGAFGEEAATQVRLEGDPALAAFTSAAKTQFRSEDPSVRIIVAQPGSDAAFESLCSGPADIAATTRAITGEERSACEKEQTEYVELPVANAKAGGEPVFLYVKQESFQRFEVEAFVDFVLSNGAAVAEKGNLSPPTEKQLGTARTRFDEAVSALG